MNTQKRYEGIGFIIVGLVCLTLAFVRDSSVLFGFAWAFISPGVMILYRYFQMSNPDKQEEYQQIATRQRIESYDERRIMLRDRSGQLAYISGFLVMAIVIIGGSLLSEFNVINKDIAQTIVIAFSLLALFQFVVGIVIYRYLDKKL